MVFKLVAISGKTQPPIPLLYTQVQDMVQESLGVLCYPFVELLELISLGGLLDTGSRPSVVDD